MPISREQLSKIIQSKSGGLCTPEGDRRFDSMAGRTSLNEVYNPDPNDYDDYNDDPWALPGQSSLSYNDNEYESRPVSQKGDFSYNQSSASSSRIPNAIKESMLNNRIDTSRLSNVSVLDQLDIKPEKKQVRENVSRQQQQTFDYSIIKAIVKECLEENKKSLLSEGSLSQIHLSGGKIRLVDNSGNIYSAQLEKTGNIKDKKK